jgi:hypothetical protein
MGRLCSVCTHPERQGIDLALLQHAVGYRSIAQRFGVTQFALMRHEHGHLAHSIHDSKELGEMLSAANLTTKVGEWHQRMEDQYARADGARDVRGAALVARTGLAAIDAFARLGPLSEMEERLAALEEGQSKDVPQGKEARDDGHAASG